MNTHRNNNLVAFAFSRNSVYKVLQSYLVLSMVILTTPVFYGCEKHTHPLDGDFTEAAKKSSVKLAVLPAEDTHIRSIDAFIFNDDSLRRIDCYQRTDDFKEDELRIGSCRGNKIAVLCANPPWGKLEWKDVFSFNRTSSIKVNLEDEDSQYPVMSATVQMTAGDYMEVKMERLTSEVELRSIQCDFSGKPYEGESITDAKVYLTNVNATCSIVPDRGYTIERIINHGGLIPEDVINFRDSTHISKDLETISIKPSHPDIRLLCYPNLSVRETIGTPFTRIVIEGKIQGETWYWPISINRGCNTGHEGIERNRRYVYDITIRSKGTKDPDTPIVPEMAETTFKTERWKEKEAYHVTF